MAENDFYVRFDSNAKTFIETLRAQITEIRSLTVGLQREIGAADQAVAAGRNPGGAPGRRPAIPPPAPGRTAGSGEVPKIQVDLAASLDPLNQVITGLARDIVTYNAGLTNTVLSMVSAANKMEAAAEMIRRRERSDTQSQGTGGRPDPNVYHGQDNRFVTPTAPAARAIPMVTHPSSPRYQPPLPPAARGGHLLGATPAATGPGGAVPVTIRDIPRVEINDAILNRIAANTYVTSQNTGATLAAINRLADRIQSGGNAGRSGGGGTSSGGGAPTTPSTPRTKREDDAFSRVNKLKARIAERERLALLEAESSRLSGGGGEAPSGANLTRLAGNSLPFKKLAESSGFAGPEYIQRIGKARDALRKALADVPEIERLKEELDEAISATGTEDGRRPGRRERRTESRRRRRQTRSARRQQAKENGISPSAQAAVDTEAAKIEARNKRTERIQDAIQMLSVSAAGTETALTLARANREAVGEDRIAALEADLEATRKAIERRQRQLQGTRAERRAANRSAAAEQRRNSPQFSAQEKADRLDKMRMAGSETVLRQRSTTVPMLHEMAQVFKEEGYDPQVTKKMTKDALIERIRKSFKAFSDAEEETVNNLTQGRQKTPTRVGKNVKDVLGNLLNQTVKTAEEEAAEALANLDRASGGTGVGQRTFRRGPAGVREVRGREFAPGAISMTSETGPAASSAAAFEGGFTEGDIRRAYQIKEARQARLRAAADERARALAMGQRESFNPYDPQIRAGIQGNGPDAKLARQSLAQLQEATTRFDTLAKKAVQTADEVEKFRREIARAEALQKKLDDYAQRAPRNKGEREDQKRLAKEFERINPADVEAKRAALPQMEAQQEHLIRTLGLLPEVFKDPMFRRGLANRDTARTELQQARDQAAANRAESIAAVSAKSVEETFFGRQNAINVGSGKTGKRTATTAMFDVNIMKDTEDTRGLDRNKVMQARRALRRYKQAVRDQMTEMADILGPYGDADFAKNDPAGKAARLGAPEAKARLAKVEEDIRKRMHNFIEAYEKATGQKVASQEIDGYRTTSTNIRTEAVAADQRVLTREKREARRRELRRARAGLNLTDPANALAEIQRFTGFQIDDKGNKVPHPQAPPSPGMDRAGNPLPAPRITSIEQAHERLLKSGVVISDTVNKGLKDATSVQDLLHKLAAAIKAGTLEIQTYVTNTRGELIEQKSLGAYSDVRHVFERGRSGQKAGAEHAGLLGRAETYLAQGKQTSYLGLLRGQVGAAAGLTKDQIKADYPGMKGLRDLVALLKGEQAAKRAGADVAEEVAKAKATTTAAGGMGDDCCERIVAALNLINKTLQSGIPIRGRVQTQAQAEAGARPESTPSTTATRRKRRTLADLASIERMEYDERDAQGNVTGKKKQGWGVREAHRPDQPQIFRTKKEAEQYLRDNRAIIESEMELATARRNGRGAIDLHLMRRQALDEAAARPEPAPPQPTQRVWGAARGTDAERQARELAREARIEEAAARRQAERERRRVTRTGTRTPFQNEAEDRERAAEEYAAAERRRERYERRRAEAQRRRQEQAIREQGLQVRSFGPTDEALDRPRRRRRATSDDREGFQQPVAVVQPVVDIRALQQQIADLRRQAAAARTPVVPGGYSPESTRMAAEARRLDAQSVKLPNGQIDFKAASKRVAELKTLVGQINAMDASEARNFLAQMDPSRVTNRIQAMNTGHAIATAGTDPIVAALKAAGLHKFGTQVDPATILGQLPKAGAPSGGAPTPESLRLEAEAARLEAEVARGRIENARASQQRRRRRATRPEGPAGATSESGAEEFANVNPTARKQRAADFKISSAGQEQFLKRLPRDLRAVVEQENALVAAGALVQRGFLNQAQASALFRERLGMTAQETKRFEADLRNLVGTQRMETSATTAAHVEALKEARAREQNAAATKRQERARVAAERATRAQINSDNQAADAMAKFTQRTKDAVAALAELERRRKAGDTSVTQGQILNAQRNVIRGAYSDLRAASPQESTRETKAKVQNVIANVSGVDFNATELRNVGGDIFRELDRSIRQAAAGNNGDQNLVEQLLFGGKGFLGRAINSIGTFIVRNFSAGIVFGLSNALGDALQQAIETEGTFIRVSAALEATGRSTSGVRTELQSISTDYGIALKDVYTTAAGLTGVFQNNDDLVAATRVIGQLDMISGGALNSVEAMKSLSSVTAAYGIEGAAGLTQIADALTVIQNRMGVNIEDTVEGAARIAGLTAQLNIPLENAMTQVAAISKMTGQTGAAAGEQYSRILSQIQTGRGQAALRKGLAGTGIDEALNARSNPWDGQADSVSGYSKALDILLANYGDLSKAEQDRIATTLGGARQAAAIQALLRKGTEVLETQTAAQDANGEAQERAAKISQTLNRQLQILQSNFVNITAQLVRSGLLNFFGALLVGTNKVLGTINDLLSRLNDLAESNALTEKLRDWGMMFLGLAITVGILGKALTALRRTIGAAGAAIGIQRGAAVDPLTGQPVAGGPQQQGRIRDLWQGRNKAETRFRYGYTPDGTHGTQTGQAQEGRRGIWNRVRGVEVGQTSVVRTDRLGYDKSLGYNQFQGPTSAPLGMGARALQRMGGFPSDPATGRAATGLRGVADNLRLRQALQADAGMGARAAASGAAAATANTAGRAMTGLGSALSRLSIAGAAASGAMAGLSMVLTAVIMEAFRSSQFASDRKKAFEREFGKDAGLTDDDVANRDRYVGRNTTLDRENKEALEGAPGYFRALGDTYNPKNWWRALKGEDIAAREAGDFTGQEINGRDIDELMHETMMGGFKGIREANTPEALAAAQDATMAEIEKQAQAINDSDMSEEQKAAALAYYESLRESINKTGSNARLRLIGLSNIDNLTAEQFQQLSEITNAFVNMGPQGAALGADGIAQLIEDLGVGEGSEIQKLLKQMTAPGQSKIQRMKADKAIAERAYQVAQSNYANEQDSDKAAELRQIVLQRMGELYQKTEALLQAEIQGAADIATWFRSQGDYDSAVSAANTALNAIEIAIREAEGDPALQAALRNQRTQIQKQQADDAIAEENYASRASVLQPGNRGGLAVAEAELDIAERTVEEYKERGIKGEALRQAELEALRAANAYYDAVRANESSEAAVGIAAAMNSVTRAQRQRTETYNALKFAETEYGVGSTEYNNALAADWSAYYAEQDAGMALRGSQRELGVAKIAPGDEIGRLQQQATDAVTAFTEAQNRFGVGSQEANQAQIRMMESNRALAQGLRAREQTVIRLRQTEAEVTGDTIRLAQLNTELANLQLAQARARSGGVRTTEVLEAEMAVMRAQLGEFQANQAMSQARSNLAIALANAAGNSVVAAQEAHRAAVQRLNEVKTQARGVRTTAVIEAEAQVATTERGAWDAILADQLATIDFNQQMGNLTANGAIAAYQEILKSTTLTEAQRRDLMLKIKGLQDNLRDTLTGSGFNIPDEINMPTAYEVRRSLALDPYIEAGNKTINDMVAMRDQMATAPQASNPMTAMGGSLQSVVGALSGLKSGAQVTNNVEVNNTVSTPAMVEAVARRVVELIGTQTTLGMRAQQTSPGLVRY